MHSSYNGSEADGTEIHPKRPRVSNICNSLYPFCLFSKSSSQDARLDTQYSVLNTNRIVRNRKNNNNKKRYKRDMCANSEHQTRTYHLRKAIMLHRTRCFMSLFSTKCFVASYVPYGAHKGRRSRTRTRAMWRHVYLEIGFWLWRRRPPKFPSRHWNVLCVQCTITRRDRKNSNETLAAKWMRNGSLFFRKIVANRNGGPGPTHHHYFHLLISI